MDDFTGVYTVQFTGIDGEGPVTVPDVKVGDFILQISNNADRLNLTHDFLSPIANDDEIDQRLADRSTFTFTALMLRR